MLHMFSLIIHNTYRRSQLRHTHGYNYSKMDSENVHVLFFLSLEQDSWACTYCRNGVIPPTHIRYGWPMTEDTSARNTAIRYNQVI